MFYEKVKELCKNKGTSPSGLCNNLGISTTNAVNWKNGRMPKMDIAIRIADALGVTVDYLMNDDSGINIVDDYVSFPVIGEVAAGYDHIACENWTGDVINIPPQYLKGRTKDEFFVLRVTGDSMYPTYQNGDKVLILRQSTLNHSGQVGVVIYNGDTGTLKRVEYADGENWMKLVPINPSYPPIKIENTELENCRVIGIPKLLIREIED